MLILTICFYVLTSHYQNNNNIIINNSHIDPNLNKIHAAADSPPVEVPSVHMSCTICTHLVV